MNDFYIKRGDRLPVIRATLSDANGVVDLSTGTVKFIYKPQYSGSAVERSATILSGPSGLIQYSWVSGDVTGDGSVGVYYGEFKATLADDKVIHFPNAGYFSFEIIDSLN